MDTQEARALAQDNELSFLRVTRSDLEFDDTHDAYADDVYARAKTNLKKLIDQKILIKEETPSLYIYELEMDGRVQTGVACCSSVEEYNHDTIKKHEKTRIEKELDRTRHITATRTQTGPVFLTYREDQTVSQLVARERESTPLYSFITPDEIRHTVWRVSSSDEFVAAFARIPCTYIADGHHRAASAARCCNDMRSANGSHTGKEEYNFFLSVIFPDSHLKILPYNRIIKHLPTTVSGNLLEHVGKVVKLTPNANPSPSDRGHVSMFFGGSWYDLELPSAGGDSANPVDALDVSKLYRTLLHPLFGIGDERTDKNLDFVGGIRGTTHLEQLVNSGRAAVAFSMFPTSVSELMTIADRNMIMAPKSTWFEPKLRDGILIHEI